MDRLRNARVLLQDQRQRPSGTIKVLLPIAFAKHYVMPEIPAFLECYPGFKRVDPLRLMLPVLPSNLVFAVDYSGGVFERRHDELFLFPLGKRIKTCTCLFADFTSCSARIGQTDVCQCPQANVTAFAIILHADHPMAATRSLQIEDETIAVGIASRLFEVFDFQRTKISHRFSSISPPHLTPHPPLESGEHRKNYTDGQDVKNAAFLRLSGP